MRNSLPLLAIFLIAATPVQIEPGVASSSPVLLEKVTLRRVELQASQGTSEMCIQAKTVGKPIEVRGLVRDSKEATEVEAGMALRFGQWVAGPEIIGHFGGQGFEVEPVAVLRRSWGGWNLSMQAGTTLGVEPVVRFLGHFGHAW